MHKLPDQFSTQMAAMLGGEFSSFVSALESSPPVSIRVNPAKHPTLQPEASVPWTQYGFYLRDRPIFTMDPLFHAGVYYVQEASSMFLEQAFRQYAPQDQAIAVLDLCAAPGGKSTHLASLMRPDSLLVSNEVIRSRIPPLTENIQKWGSPNTVVTSNDAADFESLPGFFEVVVVDAPCSGEGMFRKDVAARDEWSPENVAVCTARQKRILQSIWPSIKHNGILIYSTCTFNTLENEENLLWLSKQHDVEFLTLQTDPSWQIEETQYGPARGYRLYPHKVRGEGFFLAVVRKTGIQTEVTFRNSSKDGFTAPSKKVAGELSDWIKPGDHALIQRDETIQTIPARWLQEIHGLTKRLRVVYAGTFIAVQKHDKLIPEHSLALSTLLNDEHFFKLDLPEKDAVSYLRKENIPWTPDHRGFALATYKGTPLGWLNVLSGRMNNLYPQAWRIRMTS